MGICAHFASIDGFCCLFATGNPVFVVTIWFFIV